MATENRARADTHGHDHGHHHRDVSGGWLRPAVFGARDGLVTNVSLIAGVGGGGGSRHAIVLTGLAGLAAGAFSMAAGEFVSVSSQNELVMAEVAKERRELEHNAAVEQAELVGMLRARGISAATARQAAAEISAHPDKALEIHAMEELGVNPEELPSPFVAAGASLASFAVGAVIPLLSYRSKPHSGGQGVYVRHLSRELTALGHHVEVLSGQPYPVLDPGPVLREVPSLDLYRDEDPFRTPALAEIRDWADALETAM